MLDGRSSSQTDRGASIMPPFAAVTREMECVGAGPVKGGVKFVCMCVCTHVYARTRRLVTTRASSKSMREIDLSVHYESNLAIRAEVWMVSAFVRELAGLKCQPPERNGSITEIVVLLDELVHLRATHERDHPERS